MENSEKGAIVILDRLRAKCAQFVKDEVRQQNGTLGSDARLKWTGVLVGAGCELAAQSFLAAGEQDVKAERYLSRRKESDRRGSVRCTRLGCDRDTITACFEKGIRTNLEGEVTNSPAGFIRNMVLSKTEEESVGIKKKDESLNVDASNPLKKAERRPFPQNNLIEKVRPPESSSLEDIGFEISPTSGKATGINENRYARHLLKRFDLIYSTGERFYQYKDGVWRYAIPNALSRILRDTLHEYVPDCWKSSIERKYMGALEREAPYVEHMDSDRRYLNLSSGMLDLETLTQVPHDKKYHSTVRIPLAYDPESQCPRFTKFLDEIFDGDSDRIKVTGEMMGYCLTAETKAQCAFILFGSGANGKSKLLEVMQKLVGLENCSALPLNDLENPFSRYELVNKILNVATENEVKDGGFKTEYFKAITTGDSIRVEQKYHQGFLYNPICKLVFALNSLPYSKDKSFGFQRRLIILPFDRRFEKKDDDKNLSKKLEQELPGILNFALEGLKRLREQDYEFTKSVAIETVQEEYKEWINPMHLFSQERLVQATPEDKVHYNIIADVFKAWCQLNGHSGLAKVSNQKLLSSIREEFSNRGVTYTLGRSGERGRYLGGVQLKIENASNLSKHKRLRLVKDLDEMDDLDDIDEIG